VSIGSATNAGLFEPPVIDGILLVGSWDRKLYAFGL
jgi:hypothetical protein